MLKNNSTVRILSILMAICLWAFVIGEVNPTVKRTITDIPVEFVNADTLADRGLALGEEQEYYTSVVVKGSRSEVNALERSDILATADLYGYEEGENHISIDVIVPDGISLEEIKIPEVTVNLEKLEAVHLPVTVVFVGELDGALEAAAASVAPAEVEVKGAASVIEKVDSVRVQLDVGDISSISAVYSEVPTAWDADGKLITNVTISAQSVDVEAAVYHTKQVPLELKVTGNPDEKYGEVSVDIPKEIVVRGTEASLERITSITAESINVDHVTENCTIAVKPQLPAGVELADSSKDIGVKIEFK